MDNDWDNRIDSDENGNQWLTDGNGKYLKDERGNNIPPQHSKVISKPNEFTIFDDSKGHCALCGSLTCSGRCFK